jgi:integrase/recombinase XerD
MKKSKVQTMEMIQQTNNNFIVEKKNESSKTQLRNCINAIKEIKSKYSITAEQNRYIDKQVRNELRLIISKRPKKLPDYLNPAEIHFFKKQLLTHKAIYSMLGNLLLFTGLRISEVRNLDIRDIDFQNNQLKVVQGKGSKDRYVPAGNGLLAQLKHYVNGRTSGYVFLNSKNKPYSIRRLQQMMELCLDVCNFNKKLSTHNLRHTYACMCLSKGLRLEDIKLLLGHSSIKTTEIYAKLELGSIKDQYLQIVGEM